MGCLMSNGQMTDEYSVRGLLKVAEGTLKDIDNRIAELSREAEPVEPVKTRRCFHNIDRKNRVCTICGISEADAVAETWVNGGAP